MKESIYACGTLRTDRMGYPETFKLHIKNRKGLEERRNLKQVQKVGLVFLLCQDNKLAIPVHNCSQRVGHTNEAKR